LTTLWILLPPIGWLKGVDVVDGVPKLEPLLLLLPDPGKDEDDNEDVEPPPTGC
jgi:hypothetical protein